MKWNLEVIQIANLSNYHKNPRTLSEKQQRHLSDSIDKFGLVDKPVVNQDYTIIGGHQRVQIMSEKGETEIECWVPSRLLDEKEAEEFCIRLNRNNGDWDYDLLGNSWVLGDLLTWGFDEEDLGLGKAEKPKKPVKPTITFEFSDKQTMLEYMQTCEEIAETASAKMKVKG